MVDLLPDRPRKGRGAIGNPTGRYEPRTRQPIDDGWETGAGYAGRDAGAAPALATEVGTDASRKYDRALALMGIDAALLSGQAGHA